MRAFVLLLFVALTACNTTKHMTSHNRELEITESTTGVAVTKLDEKIDTLIKLPENSATVTATLDSLTATGFLHASDDNAEVTVIYDRRTGTVKAVGTSKAKEVPVKLDRTVLKAETVNTTKAYTYTEESKQLDKTTKANGFGWFQAGIIFALVVIIILYALLAYVRKSFWPF